MQFLYYLLISFQDNLTDIWIVNSCLKSMKHYNFYAQIERDSDTGLYVGIVPNLPGAYTQASSLEQLHLNLKEVVELCLENMTDNEIEHLPLSVGFLQVSVCI